MYVLKDNVAEVKHTSLDKLEAKKSLVVLPQNNQSVKYRIHFFAIEYIQEDAFPYDHDSTIKKIIKQETGKIVKFPYLPRIQQKPVGIIALCPLFLMLQ